MYKARMRHPITVAVLAALLGAAAPAVAAPFVYRDIILPSHDVAIDVGLGVGHAPTGPNSSVSGWGLNLEIAGSINHEVELGVRTGFRLDDGGQITQADRYGRPFNTETYGTLGDNMANPELHVRWAVARGSNVMLGLEGRAYIPIENGSRFGVMIGLPLALRVGSLRIDSGLFVPILFYPETITVVSIPIHVWFQVTNTLWFGPLFGWQHWSGNGSYTAYPFGFGLGVALTHTVDFRTWFLFPDINQTEGGRTYGGGVALQVRF
jgi:hypothetical protein